METEGLLPWERGSTVSVGLGGCYRVDGGVNMGTERGCYHGNEGAVGVGMGRGCCHSNGGPWAWEWGVATGSGGWGRGDRGLLA